MEYAFQYNVPASYTLDGNPSLYLPIIAWLNVNNEVVWDIDRVAAWKVITIRNWEKVNRDIETIATEYFLTCKTLNYESEFAAKNIQENQT